MSNPKSFSNNSDSNNFKKAVGKITSPLSNEILYNNIIQVKGDLSFVPNEYHVWLAIKVGNLLWTKQPEIIPSPEKWTREVVKAGPPSEDFSLVLLQVNKKGQCAIDSWYRFGTSTGSYPGLVLPDFYDVVILNEVNTITVK